MKKKSGKLYKNAFNGQNDIHLVLKFLIYVIVFYIKLLISQA